VIRIVCGIRLTALCLALGAVSAIAIAATGTATDDSKGFSADIVSRNAQGEVIGPAARLYVGDGKVRIETAEASAGFFLIDPAAGTAFFVRPAQHIFMDAGRSTRLSQIFVPVDPDAPCIQWQAAAMVAGVPKAAENWRCERVPEEHARAIRAYNVLSPDEQLTERWIDPTLRFAVKWQSADGATLALEHIRIAAQPETLFDLPAGYRKWDPQALIDRIRHSDVWAAPSMN
jgi:hypothetical protein